MNEFFAWLVNTGAPGWFVSVVVVGIAVNIASNIVQRRMDIYSSTRPERVRQARRIRETRQLVLARRLFTDALYRQIYIARTNISMIFAMGLFLFTTIVGLSMNIEPSASDLLLISIEQGRPIRAIGGIVFGVGAGIMLLLVGRGIVAYVAMLDRLEDFAAEETRYLALIGAYPDGYEPVFAAPSEESHG